MNSFRKPDPQGAEDQDLAARLHKELGCKDPLTQAFIGVLLIAIRVFDYKQQNYGPGNIAAFGEYGVTVRLHDKLARLINLQKKASEPADETRCDTWGDSLVYSAISLMCRWGLWPGVAPAPQYAEPLTSSDVATARAAAGRLHEYMTARVHAAGCILAHAHEGDCLVPGDQK